MQLCCSLPPWLCNVQCNLDPTLQAGGAALPNPFAAMAGGAGGAAPNPFAAMAGGAGGANPWASMFNPAAAPAAPAAPAQAPEMMYQVCLSPLTCQEPGGNRVLFGWVQAISVPCVK